MNMPCSPRCDSTGFEFSATLETLCEDVQRWSLAIETPSPLAVVTRAVWRFVEPCNADAPLSWVSVKPEPSEWSSRLEDGRDGVVLRRIAVAECAEDNVAATRALRALGEVKVATVLAGVVLTPVAAGEVADAVVRADPEDDEFVLVMAPGGAAVLGGRIWGRHTWAVIPVVGGACTLTPFVPRNDVVAVTGASVYADPPGAQMRLKVDCPLSLDGAQLMGVPIGLPFDGAQLVGKYELLHKIN